MSWFCFSRIFVFLFIFVFFSNLAYADDYGNNIEGDNYVVSRDRIDRLVEPGTLFKDYVEIFNTGTSSLDVSFSVVGAVAQVIELKSGSLQIPSGGSEKMEFVITGEDGFVGEGSLKISGGINEEILINVNVTRDGIVQPFTIELTPLKDEFNILKNFTVQTSIVKLSSEPLKNISLIYNLSSGNSSIILDEFNLNLNNSDSFIKSYSVPEDFESGEFIISVLGIYERFDISDSSFFILEKPFLRKKIFGFLPVWVLLIILFLGISGIVTYIIIKKRIAANKRYRMNVDPKKLPQKEDNALFLGKVAESSYWAYLDPNRLTVHSIVAGSTGGGKSITAQVIIEELLKKNIAVVVFDPTAQWSGMLRKCTDKKMMAHYSKFGLKPNDAQAFKGNVRMIQNARQVLDINKFINPGEIQILSLHKLQPKDMDMFVASIIRQIFTSDPKEYAGLKVLLVFDEVHRLLPKFGGSGEGFLQIERGCREFRKWGLGIMLVSQVLSDFVGEIKTNIATEVQMRTRDEGDLKRIENKYGEEFLQSLVKAGAGFGLFSNPAYNNAQPYFINFRPILHNTKRLSDEELEKYNKYNDKVDDLDFQLDELEREKVDTFDLKMEIKLVKDKIMTGSFSVVDVYLEGLVPRVQKEWDKLGKKPPERKLELVSEEEIKKAVEAAKTAKKEAEAKAKKEGGGKESGEGEQKVDIGEKIVNPITFDNGAMISSLKEMKDYLPNMDNGDFVKQVNKNKNDIQKWVKENFGDEAAKKLDGKLKKEEVVSTIESIIKGGGSGGDSGSEKKESEEKKEEGGASSEGEKKEEEKSAEQKKG